MRDVGEGIVRASSSARLPLMAVYKGYHANPTAEAWVLPPPARHQLAVLVLLFDYMLTAHSFEMPAHGEPGP